MKLLHIAGFITQPFKKIKQNHPVNETTCMTVAKSNLQTEARTDQKHLRAAVCISQALYRYLGMYIFVVFLHRRFAI